MMQQTKFVTSLVADYKPPLQTLPLLFLIAVSPLWHKTEPLLTVTHTAGEKTTATGTMTLLPLPTDCYLLLCCCSNHHHHSKIAVMPPVDCCISVKFAIACCMATATTLLLLLTLQLCTWCCCSCCLLLSVAS